MTYYEAWREYNKSKSEPFFPVFNTFKEKHLKELEAGPLRLYLYSGFHANNQHGHSWHSIEKMAEFFNTQPRTINNWKKKLVGAGLIYRVRNGKKPNHLFRAIQQALNNEPTKNPTVPRIIPTPKAGTPKPVPIATIPILFTINVPVKKPPTPKGYLDLLITDGETDIVARVWDRRVTPQC